jgi:hypothetical protein
LALGTGLETAAEARIDVGKTTCKIDDENRIEKQFISHRYFTEHLMDAFEKSP